MTELFGNLLKHSPDCIVNKTLWAVNGKKDQALDMIPFIFHLKPREWVGDVNEGAQQVDDTRECVNTLKVYISCF